MQPFEPYLHELDLKEEEWDFVAKSREHIQHTEDKVKAQQKNEERQRLERKFMAFLGILSIIAVVATIFAFLQTRKANNLYEQSET